MFIASSFSISFVLSNKEESENELEFYETSGALPATLTYNFGAGLSYIVTAYKFKVFHGHEARMPKDFYIEASNDETNWTLLDSRVDVNYEELDSTGNTMMNFNFINDTAYQYYKMTITQVHTDGQPLRIGSLGYYEGKSQGIAFDLQSC